MYSEQLVGRESEPVTIKKARKRYRFHAFDEGSNKLN